MAGPIKNRALLVGRLALPVLQCQAHARVIGKRLTVAIEESPVQAVKGTGAIARYLRGTVATGLAVVALAFLSYIVI